MKTLKLLSVLFVVTLLTGLNGSNLFAQEEDWIDMEWDTYKIAFKAPKDFTLKQNDDKAFTANGAIFTMSLKPWKDASITDPTDIALKAYETTPGTDKTIIEEKELNVNGYKGYYAYCTAIQKEKGMHMIIAGFLDPNSETNFTVQLLFWDSDDATNLLNYEAAQYILQSLKPME